MYQQFFEMVVGGGDVVEAMGGSGRGNVVH